MCVSLLPSVSDYRPSQNLPVLYVVLSLGLSFCPEYIERLVLPVFPNLIAFALPSPFILPLEVPLCDPVGSPLYRVSAAIFFSPLLL